MTHDASRRHFLRTSAALSAMGVAAPLGLSLSATARAAAATAPSDYRALVCLYLGGGNDFINTFVPYDTTSYNRYASVRGSLALSRPGKALSTSRQHNGRQVGLHPALSDLTSLYDAGRLAIVAGVGPLTGPTTRDELASGRVAFPSQIGSHNDQASTWHRLGTSAPFGWGGRIGDVFAESNRTGSAFTTISATGGYSQLLDGDLTAAFSVSDTGIPDAFFGGDSNLEKAIIAGGSSSRTNLLEKAYIQVHERLRDAADVLAQTALSESTFEAPPSQNWTAAQLRTVARIAGAQKALGVQRQIFYVDIGGFDTHGNQLSRHTEALGQVGAALVYFDKLLGQLGMRDKVTLFTTSDFGRSYKPNGDGTDHAWGAHHFVMGDAVKGKEIYGTLPSMDPQDQDFVDGNMLIPGVSVEQYAATLATWMGVPSDLQDAIFPLLSRYSTRSAGFMKRAAPLPVQCFTEIRG